MSKHRSYYVKIFGLDKPSLLCDVVWFEKGLILPDPRYCFSFCFTMTRFEDFPSELYDLHKSGSVRCKRTRSGYCFMFDPHIVECVFSDDYDPPRVYYKGEPYACGVQGS